MFVRRFFPRSIAASMMVVYYAGAGVVQKGRHRQRNDSFTTIEMHVAAICAFAWTCRYAVLRSIFPITMRFDGHLMRMAAIMWNILRRHNPYKHGCTASFSTWLFTDSTEAPGKEHSGLRVFWYIVLLSCLLRTVLPP